MKIKPIVSFIITPLICLFIILFVDLLPDNPKATYMLAIALLMAVWWITEVVPLAVTSLIPVALFPLFGIMDSKEVSAAYFNDVIFLFMGGFMIALAMEKWGLHRRIALHILKLTGTSPARILLGFMLSTAFISMWISNTATVMMMLPILMSIISKLEENTGKAGMGKFSAGLLLGVAYSASIGGVATLVGTPPNLSLVRIYQIYFPEAPPISFAQWLIFAFPFAALFLVFTWYYLYRSFRPPKETWVRIRRDTFSNELKTLGKTSREEKAVLAVFILTALLWLFRADITIGTFTLKGWTHLFRENKFINDGTIAIFMALILFVFPSSKKRGDTILDWATASKLPWHILLLFGGGFALASGIKESELSLWFGRQLLFVSSFNIIIVILCISLIITFLTELTSNTATTEMILPILAGISISTHINPLLLMLPATLSASMAFMLPVATPPNAIVFGTSRLSISQMARAGLVLNLVGAVLITLFTYFWGGIVF